MNEEKFGYFFRRLVVLALPMMLQSLLFSSAGFVDTLMISQLGTTEVAASGIGARFFWFSTLFIWGMGSGMSVLLAQYWGAKDPEGLKQNLAIGMVFATVSVALFFLVCTLTPGWVSGLMSTDPATQLLADQYLRLLGIAMLVSGVSICLDASLRAIGKPQLGLYTYIAELAVNVLLNYMLIFGNWGAPQLGLAGAGIATVTARVFRVLLVFMVIYKWMPVLRLSLSHLAAVRQRSLVSKYLDITLPIAINSLIWSVGIFSLQVIISRMGPTELAAMTIFAPLEAIGLAIVAGISGATATILGNSLGANKLELSRRYSRYAVICAGTIGVITASGFLLLESQILGLYTQLDDKVITLLASCFPLIALSIVLRAMNITMIVGILRSGGDTKFCMKLDVVCQWFWALPVTFFVGVVLQLPLPYVFLAMLSEELVKVLPAGWRVFGNRWANNLVGSPRVA